MKKTYMTPEMEVMNIESETLMLAISGEVDTNEEGFDQRSGDRRGSWGNLWN